MLDMVKKVAGAVFYGVGVIGLIGAVVGLIVAAPFVLLVWGYMFLALGVIAGPFLLWEKLKEDDDVWS